jgi:hypothetical protein
MEAVFAGGLLVLVQHQALPDPAGEGEGQGRSPARTAASSWERSSMRVVMGLYRSCSRLGGLRA